jgi:hypothetical protein
VQINLRTAAKDLVKMLEETDTNVSISTVKQVLYRQPERLLSKEEATAPKLPLKKARLRFVTTHGDKDHTFLRNLEGVSLVWAGCLLLLCEMLGLWVRVTSFRVLAEVGIAALYRWTWS